MSIQNQKAEALLSELQRHEAFRDAVRQGCLRWKKARESSDYPRIANLEKRISDIEREAKAKSRAIGIDADTDDVVLILQQAVDQTAECRAEVSRIRSTIDFSLRDDLEPSELSFEVKSVQVALFWMEVNNGRSALLFPSCDATFFTRHLDLIGKRRADVFASILATVENLRANLPPFAKSDPEPTSPARRGRRPLPDAKRRRYEEIENAWRQAREWDPQLTKQKFAEDQDLDIRLVKTAISRVSTWRSRRRSSP